MRYLSGEIGENTERIDRGHRYQEDTEGEDRRQYRSGKAEAIRIIGPQGGEDRRQYRSGKADAIRINGPQRGNDRR